MHMLDTTGVDTLLRVYETVTEAERDTPVGNDS
jgi:hypothetical protein